LGAALAWLRLVRGLASAQLVGIRASCARRVDRNGSRLVGCRFCLSRGAMGSRPAALV